MSNKEPNPTEELHNRFRAELKKPVRERYFPEDDLLNVIDTASDTYDDYLRLEALMMGARLYPDSTALLERRAIYYLDTDTPMFTSFMNDYEDVQSVMMDILRLNLLEGLAYDEIVEKVEEFLVDFKFAEDEEVIQFVQTLVSLKLDRWLVDNLDRLKKITPYIPTLLYEYAFAAEESEALEKIEVKVLEELTEIEPYVADYWTRLALAHTRAGEPEKAFTAIEYALAISPDNVVALRAVLSIEDSVTDITSVSRYLDRLYELEPDDPEVAFMMVMNAYDTPRAKQLLDEMSARARGSRSMALRAIFINYPGIDSLLEDVYDSGIDSAVDWRSFADFAYECFNDSAVRSVFRVYEKKSGEALAHEQLIFRIMFRAGNYAVATKVFTDAGSGSLLFAPENVISSYSMFVVGLLRMGEYDSAREAALSMLQALREDKISGGSPIEQRAMESHLKDILKRLDSKRKTDWNKFEPL